MEPAEMEEQTGPEELVGWWMDAAHDEVHDMASKMIEYGGMARATDLLSLGSEMAELMNWEGLTDAEKTELGIAFYMQGKVGRIMAALKERRFPSDDTWHDISIYAKMVRRTREKGGWPV